MKPYVSYFLVACFGALVGFVFASQTAIAQQLDDWQLVPHPDHVSELYFTNQQLPREAHSTTPQVVAFTVHNIEYQTTAYHYRLTAVADSGVTQPLVSGEVTLAHDTSQVITEPISIPLLAPRVAIKVELEYKSMTPDGVTFSPRQQSIKYWVNMTGFSS